MAASDRNAGRGYFRIRVGFYNAFPPHYRINPDQIQLLPLNLPRDFVGGKRREPLRLAEADAEPEAKPKAGPDAK